MSSLDFRKPRADTPIVPQTALFRKRVISQKRPKGRRGRKIKGKRVGSSVSYQDPNFILIKAADEARKERELKVRAGERAEQELRQAGERLDIQRQEAADARVDRRRAEGARQQNVILLRDQVRLQAADNLDARRFRQAGINLLGEFGGRQDVQAQRQLDAQGQRDIRDGADRDRLYAEFRAIHAQGERRNGEQQARMDAIYRDALDRGERHTADQMRALDDRQRRRQRPFERRGRGTVEEVSETSGSEDSFQGKRFEEVTPTPRPEEEREEEEVDLPQPRERIKQRKREQRSRDRSETPSLSEQEIFQSSMSQTFTPEQVSAREEAAKKLGEQLGRAEATETGQRVTQKSRGRIAELEHAQSEISMAYLARIKAQLTEGGISHRELDNKETLEKLHANQSSLRTGGTLTHPFRGALESAELKDVIHDDGALTGWVALRKRAQDEKQDRIRARDLENDAVAAESARGDLAQRGMFDYTRAEKEGRDPDKARAPFDREPSYAEIQIKKASLIASGELSDVELELETPDQTRKRKEKDAKRRKKALEFGERERANAEIRAREVEAKKQRSKQELLAQQDRDRQERGGGVGKLNPEILEAAGGGSVAEKKEKRKKTINITPRPLQEEEREEEGVGAQVLGGLAAVGGAVANAGLAAARYATTPREPAIGEQTGGITGVPVTDPKTGRTTIKPVFGLGQEIPTTATELLPEVPKSKKKKKEKKKPPPSRQAAPETSESEAELPEPQPEPEPREEAEKPVKVDRTALEGGAVAIEEAVSPYEKLVAIGGGKSVPKLWNNVKAGIDYEPMKGAEGGDKNPNHPLQLGEETFPSGQKFVITDRRGKLQKVEADHIDADRLYPGKKYTIRSRTRVRAGEDKDEGDKFSIGFMEHDDEADNWDSEADMYDGARRFGSMGGKVLRDGIKDGTLGFDIED